MQFCYSIFSRFKKSKVGHIFIYLNGKNLLSFFKQIKQQIKKIIKLIFEKLSSVLKNSIPYIFLLFLNLIYKQILGRLMWLPILIAIRKISFLLQVLMLEKVWLTSWFLRLLEILFWWFFYYCSYEKSNAIALLARYFYSILNLNYSGKQFRYPETCWKKRLHNSS